MKRIRSLVVAAVIVPALALAQPKSADDWYKEGETQYNLGNFDKAADSFKQGFALENVESKKPAYLYNVAQAYRQAHKCSDAAFFYKRYLSMKDQDTAKPLTPAKRAEIEGWIKELEDCAKSSDAIAKKPPDGTLPPDGRTGTGTGTGTGTTGTGTTGTGHTTTTTGTGTGTTTGTGSGSGSGTTVATGSGSGSDDGDGDEDDGGSVHKTVEAPPPKLISARFLGGAAKVSTGGLNVPVQASFGLIAGYPLQVMPKLQLDLGVAGTFTPVPYQNTMTMMDKTATFISVLGDVGATYTVAPKIGVRGDLGLGVLMFSGMSDAGNPFTAGGAPTSGALTMFNVRVGVSADYAITPNVIATVAPITFSYSPPKSGLRDDIKSITRLDFMVGIGYRM